MIITRLTVIFILFGLSSCQVRREVAEANYEDFPHQVQIVVTYADESVGGGTGTLILDKWGNQWVLTCAHVFQNVKGNGAVVSAEVRIPSEGFAAEASHWWSDGSYNIYEAEPEYEEEYNYEEMDIALVKLKTNLMTRDGMPARVTAATLPEEDDAIEDFSEVRFAGFGQNNRRKDDILLEGRSYKLPDYISYHLEFKLEGHHTMKKAERIYEYYRNVASDEEKRELNMRFELEYPSHFFTGVRRPHDTGSHAGTGDSGCGLFKMGKSTTVHGVLIIQDYENYRRQQYTRPIKWVKVADFKGWIEGKMEAHSDRKFRQRAGNGNLQNVVLAAVFGVCVYFL